MKAAIVERFNRTLKEKMWRFFTHKKSFRYMEVLKDLLTSYNNSYHRTIKTTPRSVTSQNEDSIWHTMYGHPKLLPDETAVRFKFKIGDLVRISKVKRIFDKGYTANWTREIFKVFACEPRKPPVYRLTDLHPTKPVFSMAVSRAMSTLRRIESQCSRMLHSDLLSVLVSSVVESPSCARSDLNFAIEQLDIIHLVIRKISNNKNVGL